MYGPYCKSSKCPEIYVICQTGLRAKWTCLTLADLARYPSQKQRCSAVFAVKAKELALF